MHYPFNSWNASITFQTSVRSSVLLDVLLSTVEKTLRVLMLHHGCHTGKPPNLRYVVVLRK